MSCLISMHRGDLNNKQLQLLGRFASAMPLALVLSTSPADRDRRSPFSVRPRRQQEDSCKVVMLVTCIACSARNACYPTIDPNSQ
jgi:hypothetical protein